MLRTVLIYGVALALGAVGLGWLQAQLWAPSQPMQVYVGLIAGAFLAFGIWVGARLFRRESGGSGFEPNDRALAALGITEREYEVLNLLASGRSNKEIALRLEVSPNTVKTHVARLYEKLDAVRRTDAVVRARELRLIP